MWVLLLPLGLGAALAPRGRGDPSLGCWLCHSPHRARAQANATLGATVTLGCPAAGVPLGRLRAEHWYFWGDTAGDAVTVCSQNRCHPPYEDRAALVSPPGTPGTSDTPGPPETPRGLLLRGLRDGDAGTYSCLLLGDDDCACGEVTLRLGEVTLRGGVTCSPPCSRATPRGSFGLVLILLFLLLLLWPGGRVCVSPCTRVAPGD